MRMRTLLAVQCQLAAHFYAGARSSTTLPPRAPAPALLGYAARVCVKARCWGANELRTQPKAVHPPPPLAPARLNFGLAGGALAHVLLIAPLATGRGGPLAPVLLAGWGLMRERCPQWDACMAAGEARRRDGEQATRRAGAARGSTRRSSGARGIWACTPHGRAPQCPAVAPYPRPPPRRRSADGRRQLVRVTGRQVTSLRLPGGAPLPGGCPRPLQPAQHTLALCKGTGGL